MKFYVLMMLAILSLDVVGKYARCAPGDVARTPGGVAADTVFNIMLLAWGLVAATNAGYFGGAV